MKIRALVSALLLLVLNLIPAHAGLDPIAEAEDHRDPSVQALTLATHSAKTAQRIRAARAWGRIQKPESITPLLELLKDPQIQVRAEAAFALGQLGWEAQFSGSRESEITQALSLALATEKKTLNQAITVEALGKVALKSTPDLMLPLLTQVKSPHPVLAEALLALYRYRLVLKLRDGTQKIEDLSQPVMDALLLHAHHSDETVRRNVAYFFARTKDVRGVPTLRVLAKDKSEWVRYFALSGLTKQGSPEGLPEAVSATKDKNPWIQVAALNAIAAMGGSASTPNFGSDPNPFVKAAYTKVLALQGAPALPSLEGILLDSNPYVQGEALKAWAELKKGDEIAVLSRISEPFKPTALKSSWVLRSAAVEASSVLSENLRLNFLALALKDADVRVRAAGLDALSTFQNTAQSAVVMPYLEAALISKELAERGSAVSALNGRKESNIMALAWTTYQASSDEKWTEMREEIVKLWGSQVSDETSGYLRSAAVDSSLSVAGLAQKTLRDRGITNLPPLPSAQFSFTPDRELKLKGHPVIILQTERGRIELELFPEAAPIHCANLAGFVSRGGYDGLPVHRVVPGFVAQGGDPDGTGWGSAGYSLRAEINSKRFVRGALGMPRSTGFDTGGVQFFITQVPTPHLDGQYTVFGRVISGLDVLDRLTQGDKVTKAWVKKGL